MSKVKVVYLNKSEFYETALALNELKRLEYSLASVPFEELDSFFKESEDFSPEKNYQTEFDYVISLVGREYNYLADQCSDNEMKQVYLTKRKLHIEKRNSIAEAILQMFDCSPSVEPKIVNEKITIEPWNSNDESWIDRTAENIIHFFARLHKKPELAL